MILTLHIVSSLDGFIAKKDNSISWFDTPDYYEQGIEQTNTEAFLQTIDCYIMGAKTYEHALALSGSYGWAYGETPVLVLSNRKLPVSKSSVTILAGDLQTILNDHIKPKYQNVWLVGGATLARDFLQQKLVDEIRLSVLPILLGKGLPLFSHSTGTEQQLHLKNITAYKTGMAELWYEVKKAAIE